MKIKKGSTLELVIEFTDDEWDSMADDAQVTSEVKTGSAEYPLTVEFDESKKIISLSADTSNWIVGTYKADVFFIVNDRRIYIPGEDFIRFELINPITNT